MSRKNKRPDGARTSEAQKPSSTPWWQVILPCRRQCGKHRAKFERVIKNIQTEDRSQALICAERMLMESQTVVGVPFAFMRTAEAVALAAT